MKIDALSVTAIEIFLKKNQIANQTGSKEVRLTTKEMNEVSSALAGVMTGVVAVSIENDQLKVEIAQLKIKLQSSDVTLDGGGFIE